MTKLIRKYQKWALAFFGVLLMLTFLGNRGTGGQTDSAEHVVGYLDGKPVLNSDLAATRAELLTIERFTSIQVGYEEYASLLAAMFGRQLANEFEEKPEFYYLLKYEARKSGTTANAADLDEVMTKYYQGPPSPSEEYTAARDAVTGLFQVKNRANQLASDVKISKPFLDHSLAEVLESIGINFVQLQASDYAARVPAPTTQQVQDQFNKFSDTLPGTVQPQTNPFGFGYKLPEMAEAQYITILPRSILDAVIATGPDGIARPAGWSVDQWWDLAGKKYYLGHQEDYRELPPTTSTSKPTAPPGIQPYGKVRDDVLTQIRQPATEKLTQDIKTYLNTTLNSGWQGYKQYASATPTPATEPTTPSGDPYSSFKFLQDVANQIFTKFNVLAIAHETGKPLPPGILLATPELKGVASFLTTQTSSYLAKPNPTALAVMADLMRPSPPVQSSSTDPVVAIRVVRVLPATAPKDMTTVRPLVEMDLRKSASYELAKADAAALLAAANNGVLKTTALALGHPMQSTSPLMPLSLMQPKDSKIKPTDVIVPPLGNDAAESLFIKQAFGLLGTYDPKTNPNPAKLIEMPALGRVFVTQLKDLNADWSSESYYKKVMLAQQNDTRAIMPRLQQKWFDYGDVVRRTGYKTTKTTGG